MSKSSSSKRWLQRQGKDPYVKKIRQSHYRSRAVYKLQEIDRKRKLFKPGQTVIDLGAAPGSWSQYVVERVGANGKVIALDMLSMEPIEGVIIIEGDFTEQATLDSCLSSVGNSGADLVISDMAPNITGIRDADQAKTLYLLELALDLARQVLNPGGDLLMKVFEGAGVDDFRKELSQSFQRVSNEKPAASRDQSREFYILARHINI